MHDILEIRNLNAQERAVMEALLRSPRPVSQRELMSRMRKAPSQATLTVPGKDGNMTHRALSFHSL